MNLYLSFHHLWFASDYSSSYARMSELFKFMFSGKQRRNLGLSFDDVFFLIESPHRILSVTFFFVVVFAIIRILRICSLKVLHHHNRFKIYSQTVIRPLYSLLHIGISTPCSPETCSRGYCASWRLQGVRITILLKTVVASTLKYNEGKKRGNKYKRRRKALTFVRRRKWGGGGTKKRQGIKKH